MNTRRLTTKEFIIRAYNTHGDRYDYSLVQYVNARVKIKIICPEHGLFEQRPNSHLSQQGCPQCVERGFNFSKPATLYVLMSEDGSILKIGISSKLKNRINTLQKSTPFKYNGTDPLL